MKTRYFIYSMLAVALLSASCVKEKADYMAEGIPMQVQPFLQEETKGSIETATIEEFTLQVKSADYLFSYCDQFSKNGTSWAAPKQFYWKSETDPVRVTAAYYGYHSFTPKEFEEGVSLTLPNNQRSQDRINKADLLTVPASVIKYEDTADGILPLAFSHALTHVRFVITLGSDFYKKGYGKDGNPISCIFVDGTDGQFHFNPATGEVTAQPDSKQDIKPFPIEFIPGSEADMTAKAIYEVILVPQTLAAGALTVHFSVCEELYTWNNPEEITFRPGEKRTVYLSINQSPAPSQHIGGHKYVELGDGIKWATCNVGARTPYEYGEQYWWSAVDPVKYSHWRTGNYEVVDAMTHFSAYKDGDNLRPEDDAATSNWGAPWRMATADDWTHLFDKDKFTWQNVSNYHGSGVTGYLVTSKISGYEGNSVFFPHTNKTTSFIGTATGFFYLTGTLESERRPLFAHEDGLHGYSAFVYIDEIIRAVAD